MISIKYKKKIRREERLLEREILIEKAKQSKERLLLWVNDQRYMIEVEGCNSTESAQLSLSLSLSCVVASFILLHFAFHACICMTSHFSYVLLVPFSLLYLCILLAYLHIYYFYFFIFIRVCSPCKKKKEIFWNIFDSEKYFSLCL